MANRILARQRVREHLHTPQNQSLIRRLSPILRNIIKNLFSQLVHKLHYIAFLAASYIPNKNIFCNILQKILSLISNLVELSGLDSKKYQTILKFKSQLPDCPPEHILSENITAGNKQVDEYGELAVKHLTQTHREFNEDELQEIVSLYQAGKSTRKIGEMFGVCKTTIANMLRRQGVNVTRSKVQARLDADEVIAMYKNEITAEKIAKQFGVNPQTILNCLRSHGVKIRSRWDYKQE